MRRILHLLGLASLAIMHGSATAEFGAMYFDCDATPGHFSEFRLDQASQPPSIVGELQPTMLYKDPKWAPLAQVVISDASDQRVGIRLVSDKPTTDVVKEGASLVVQIFQKVQGQAIAAEQIDSVVLGQSLPFSISMDGDRVILRAGTTERVANLKLNPDRKVELGCSTGDFHFTNVSVNAATSIK